MSLSCICINLKRKLLFPSAFVLVAILSACDSSSSSNKEQNNITLNMPDSVLTARAVVYSNIFARVTINGADAQTFDFSDDAPRDVNVDNVILNEDNDVTIVWFERYRGRDLELARQTGTFFGDASGRATIALSYDYSADEDLDGVTNLSERENDTCPYRDIVCASNPAEPSNSTPTLPTMKAIAGGSFIMGTNDPEAPDNEKPAHEVTLTGFNLAEHEVTVGEWNICVDAGGCSPVADPDWLVGEENRDLHPVAGVTWDQIQEYIAWINTFEGANFRLPTEAEFEYALRAGTTTTYFYGENGDDYCDFANGSRSEICDDGFPRSSPVKSFSPNSFGLFDMNGNVAEWVQDCKHENYVGAPGNGEAWLGDESQCGEGVMRGGNHLFVPVDFRITNRRLKTRFRDFAEVQEGFRLASD